MRVYRVTKTKWARDIGGAGAGQVGGRWNSPGVPVCYTASDPFTALQEVLGSGVPLSVIRAHYSLVEIEVEGRQGIKQPRKGALPDQWGQIPFGVETQRFGDVMVRGGALAFRVPSLRSAKGHNYVLNPAHARFGARVRVASTTPMSEVLDELLSR